MAATRRLPLPLHALPLTAAFMLPNLVTPLMELWRGQIGFSSGVLSAVFVAYIGGLAPAFLLAAASATRWGRRRVVMTALSLGILACLLYVLAGSVVVLLSARVMTGLCSGLVLVLGTGAIKDEARADELQAATFLATSGVAVGLAGGPLVAGLAATWLPAPTKTVFVIEAVLLACCLPIVSSQHETDTGRPRSWLPFGAVGRKARNVVLAGLGAFGPGMTSAAIILALAPTILLRMGGTQGPLAAGLVAGGMYAVSPCAQALVRTRSSLSLIRASILVIVVAMGTMLAALVTNSLVVFALAAALIGAGQGISNLGSFGLIHQQVQGEQIAGATSLLSLGTYTCASLVPLLGGVLLDWSTLVTAGGGMAAAVVAMCVGGLWVARGGFLEDD